MPQVHSVVTPIIHMNGDCREVLVDRLEVAYAAVNAAMDALRECCPHGRNYYPEPGRMVLALVQHRMRQEHLKVVSDSLEAEAIQIQKENQ